jgi:hypothetical protein
MTNRRRTNQIRGTIRQYVAADAAVSLAIVVVLWFWLGLALDYGLFKLSGFDWALDAPLLFRVIAQLALVFGLLGVLIVRRDTVKKVLNYAPTQWLRTHLLDLPAPFHLLIAAVFAPFFLVYLAFRFVFWLRTADEDREMALVLEKRFPNELGDRLITAVELSDIQKQKEYGFSTDMIEHTIGEARERLKTLPVSSVFNWDRIRNKGYALAAIMVGSLVAAYAAYAGVNRGSAQKFTSEFGDTTSVWFERNLLLRNTPWPRKAHLELVGFPGNELRIGKDATAPKIKARAFKWVIADRANALGWRALTVGDLGEKLPGTANFGASLFANNSGKKLPDEARGWDIDRIESEGGDCNGVPELITKLESLANDSRMSRTLRKLTIPDEVSLNYGGQKTRGKINLAREPNNNFSGEVSGLKESVRFIVRGLDFSTTPRGITLVPPPMFQKITRTEYQPAYLYHMPPVIEGKQDFQSLKGLRQVLGEKDLSLTGDKSLFTIMQGTEFVLRGQADKPLKQIVITPKIGKLPGAKVGDTTPLTLQPEGANRDSFTLSFRGADRPTANMEFEVSLVDPDDVTTTRSILVQVTEDQPPQVELAVDVLRKLGNSYLVTPTVKIPFITESKVKDDAGLSKLVFAYTYQQVDADVTVEAKKPFLANIFAGAPTMPSIMSPIRTAIGAQLMSDTTDSAQSKPVKGEYAVQRYLDEFAKRQPDTLETLKKKLDVPQPPDEPQSIKEIAFLNQDSDVLNLALAIPNLKEKESIKMQPRYKLEMNLLATDTNYETGPKVGQSVEQLRFMVVSEAELLSEMSKDEEAQIAKLDDVIKRLREAQNKLSQSASQLRDLNPPPDVLVVVGVRGADIGQDLGKARELTLAIQNEYRRLEKEARYNDIVQLQKRLENEILRDLNGILETGFNTAEDTHKAYLDALTSNRRPDNALIAKDQSDLASLLAQVQALRDKLGESVTLSKTIERLRKIQEQQEASGKVIEIILANALQRLRMPVIASIEKVELKVGEKKALKNPLNWLAFDGNEYKVKFDGPTGGELILPAEMKVPDDKDEIAYEITAGNKPGEYKFKIVPTVGNPVEVTVVVK